MNEHLNYQMSTSLSNKNDKTSNLKNKNEFLISSQRLSTKNDGGAPQDSNPDPQPGKRNFGPRIPPRKHTNEFSATDLVEENSGMPNSGPKKNQRDPAAVEIINNDSFEADNNRYFL
jgi:hypothetical protein